MRLQRSCSRMGLQRLDVGGACLPGGRPSGLGGNLRMRIELGVW